MAFRSHHHPFCNLENNVIKLFYISWVPAQFCPLHSQDRPILSVFFNSVMPKASSFILEKSCRVGNLGLQMSLSPIKMENGDMNPFSAYHGLAGLSYPFLWHWGMFEMYAACLGTSCRSCLLGGWWEWTPSEYLSVSKYIFTYWRLQKLVKCHECGIEKWLWLPDMSRFM